MKQENLAANFSGFLASIGYKENPIEWRILGQEQDGSILVSWIFVEVCGKKYSNIGIYSPIQKALNILYKFDKVENVIQGSVNIAKCLLTYVVKYETNEPEISCQISRNTFYYEAFIVEIKSSKNGIAHKVLEKGRSNQVMTQFLWLKHGLQDETHHEKFLIFIHGECILLFTTLIKRQQASDLPYGKINFLDDETWFFDSKCLTSEAVVHKFIWAQWDPIVQSLYYIHLKPVSRSNSLLEKEEGNGLSPMLSALQFNANLPTETVLNIPLNLPKIPSNATSVPNLYEDSTVPLCIHDSSLNLSVVSDESGMIFVCHYYLYQPIKPPTEDSGKISNVHFAYSVTLVHHGCVIHCVMPEIPWHKAKLMKPTFGLHGDHHMLVFQPDFFVHLLDVGQSHEPCCHIVCPAFNKHHLTHLVPCLKWGPLAYDSLTLDLVSLHISKSHLVDAFRSDSSISNRLSIVHYFLVHSNDVDVLSELLGIIMENPLSVNTVAFLKEALVAGTYNVSKKELPAEARPLSRLLPLTSANVHRPTQAKVSNRSVGISHENLWNSTMMLLSPQQRLSPYRTDIWNKLWDCLNESNKETSRFSSENVTEKLMFSLTCYQPEALSGYSTPLSPRNRNNVSGTFTSSPHLQKDVLPFIELDSCTASKQEHVVSVNLREIGVHLVKHSAKQIRGFRWLKHSFYERSHVPTHAHSVAAHYASAQLELSRLLCAFVCRAAGVDARVESSQGFRLIDQLSKKQQYVLFMILERYYLAVESIAFPLPHGFTSFFAYLGYRTLSFEMFLQYVIHHGFELQIDVLKEIIKDIDDSKQGVEKKLALISTLPRSRAYRLLKNWKHSISLMIRGRDHSANVLSGNLLVQPVGCVQCRNKSATSPESATYSFGEKLSPLEKFLDMLTAKASLCELNFNLLIETVLGLLNEFDA